MLKPKQRVPQSVKNTDEWKDENVRFFYKNCTGRTLSKMEVTRLFKMAAGYLEEHDYLYVTDPLGVRNRPALAGHPGEVKNMDIISPILMLLMGEKTKRPNQYTVFAKNSQFPSQKAQRQFELWEKNIHLMFVNEMIKIGQYVPGSTDDQGQPIQEPQSPEEIQMQLSNMSDWMSIQGQEALDYIRFNNELDRNFRKGFYDWLVTNSVFSYKSVLYDDVVHEIVPYAEIEWLAGPNVDYLEDGDAVKRTQYMTINQIIDNFRDLDGMTDDILDDLEAYGTGFRDASTQKMFSQTEVFYNRLFGSQHGYIATSGDAIEVCHLTWKSSQMVKRVSGTNVMGNYTIEYDEDYQSIQGETVEVKWNSMNYEGYMLGGKHIIGVQPIPISRTSMSNESVCKLPYNGRTFHSREIKAKSPVQKLEVFQKRYNVLYHFLDKVMNKNKDKFTILPLSMIPNKPGWDELTTIYYADATGFLFVDDSDPRTMQALQYVKVLDMALSQYIEFVHKLLDQVKSDAEEVMGINRQRKGETMASDAVSNNQQATMRSVVSTEELFVEYDEFEERELQGLMDISKFAFVKGKKASYISSDGKVKYLDVIPEAYMNADFGVFVKNGGREAQKLTEFKQSAFAFAQNQMKPSLVAKIVDSDNLAELIIQMEQAEQELEQSQQAQAQAEQTQQQAELQEKVKENQDKLTLGYYTVDANNLTKREIAFSAPVVTPQGMESEASKSQLETVWQGIERDKTVLKVEAEKYKADRSVDVARINAKSKPKQGS